MAEILAEFSLGEQNMPELFPRYNIAPSQPVLVVREISDNSSTREALSLRWGLIPSWADDPAIGNRLINARCETVAEKPAFRTALRRRRCLVAADGFYEWKAEGGNKQPYFIHLADDHPFAFAGLWESWEGPDHSSVESCTLLTTQANNVMWPIHHRMPVILQSQDYGKWLDPSEQEPKALVPLLGPYAGDNMEAYPVGRLVNNPSHEVPDCISRLSDSVDQTRLF